MSPADSSPGRSDSLPAPGCARIEVDSGVIAGRPSTGTTGAVVEASVRGAAS